MTITPREKLIVRNSGKPLHPFMLVLMEGSYPKIAAGWDSLQRIADYLETHYAGALVQWNITHLPTSGN